MIIGIVSEDVNKSTSTVSTFNSTPWDVPKMVEKNGWMESYGISDDLDTKFSLF